MCVCVCVYIQALLKKYGPTILRKYLFHTFYLMKNKLSTNLRQILFYSIVKVSGLMEHTEN